MPNFNDEDRDSSTDDDWDASSAEEEEKKPVAAPAGKKKKGLAAKIAEREAKEAEARKKQREMADLTPAQKKAMIEKEEERNAEDFLGEDDDNINLNKHVPKSKHEFQVYTELICARFEGLSESPFYEEFVKDVTRSLIKPLNLEKTRNVEQVLKVQINEQVKTGKKTKNKSKKQLNTGGGKGGIAIYNDDDYDDDLDDLMWMKSSVTFWEWKLEYCQKSPVLLPFPPQPAANVIS